MKGLARLLALLLAAPPAVAAAAAPQPQQITPELIAGAKAEGKVVFYTTLDLLLADKLAQNFRKRYPGITLQLERIGTERLFQRLEQERSVGLHIPDVVNSTDAVHFLIWKKAGVLAPYLPKDVAEHFGPEDRDPDGTYATWRASLSIMGYNSELVPPSDVPKSYADLLDPKWNGKLVKADPNYSGTITTATYAIVHTLGWPYLHKLSAQHVMQVQSSNDPPKKIAQGERAVMVDGNEYTLFNLQDKGNPVAPIYPEEGSVFSPSPTGILADAPHPNAARLFQNYLFSHETQQFLVDVGNLRSMDDRTVEKPGRKPLKDVKLLREDPAAIEQKANEIRWKYTQIFGS